MKNSNRGISKSKLIKGLKAQGLTMERNFAEQKWEVSDGKSFKSLAEIAMAYKV